MTRYKSLSEAMAATKGGRVATSSPEPETEPKTDLQDTEALTRERAEKLWQMMELEKKRLAQHDPDARQTRMAELEARIESAKQELRALRDESAGLAHFLTLCPKDGEVQLTRLYMGYVGVMAKAMYPAYRRDDFVAALEMAGYTRKRKSDGWYFQGLGSPWGKGLIDDGT